MSSRDVRLVRPATAAAMTKTAAHPDQPVARALQAPTENQALMETEVVLARLVLRADTSVRRLAVASIVHPARKEIAALLVALEVLDPREPLEVLADRARTEMREQPAPLDPLALLEVVAGTAKKDPLEETLNKEARDPTALLEMLAHLAQPAAQARKEPMHARAVLAALAQLAPLATQATMVPQETPVHEEDPEDQVRMPNTANVQENPRRRPGSNLIVDFSLHPFLLHYFLLLLLVTGRL